jgi:hypothetical protein
VSWDSRDGDKDEYFWEKLLDALTEGLHRGQGVHIRSTEVPQVLLKGMLLDHANQALFARRQSLIRTILNPSDGLVIESFDRRGPAHKRLIVWELLFEVMDIA